MYRAKRSAVSPIRFLARDRGAEVAPAVPDNGRGARGEG